MAAILKGFGKFPSSKTFVEEHRQNRRNTCRYSFDIDVIQIIAICAVLFLSLSDNGSNLFFINCPEKHRIYLFCSLCQFW